MKQQLTNYILRLSTCIFIILSTGAYAQWNTIYTTTISSNSYPYQINYTADSAIFVATKKDFIYSKNNGLSFIGTNSFVTTPTVTTYNTYREFADISFASKDTGTIAGFSNVSFTYYPFAQNATGNFTTWNLNHTIIPGAAFSKVNSVKHFKNQKVYVFDNSTNLYYSSNGGTSWILKNTINTATPILGYGMSMINEQLGYFATMQGIFKTTDGGQTKTYVPGFPSAYLANIKKIRFRDISNGYIIAANNLGENKLFKTTNGGNTWQDVFQGKLPDALVDVNFPTNDTGFVATASYILQTFNGGTEWYIQRFTNTDFSELEFIDKNNGAAVAAAGFNSLKVMKYIPNSISSSPFAVFNFQTNYCCNGQVCNINNYGSPSWTYKWYVNNVLSSTAFTPSGLILPYTGNNSVKLVANNGVNKDSVSVTIYNAPVFFGGGNFNIVCYDSTICKNSQAYLYVGNYSSQMGYAAFSNSVQISPWVSQSSGNLLLSTSGLNFNDTLITVQAASGYSNCPGNSFSKTQNIKVLPLPPSNLMDMVSDSICYYETAKIRISPCTAKTTYTVYLQGNISLTTFTAPTGGSYIHNNIGLQNSRNYYYASRDSNNCLMSGSPMTHVKVDSLWIRVRTTIPAVLVGDTITLFNESVAANYNWIYSPGTTVVSNNDSTIKLKYGAAGEHGFSLKASNLTGCRDSISYPIHVYNDLNEGTGQAVCFSDTTSLLQEKQLLYRSNWYDYSSNYHRFHTDIHENYYMARNVFYGNINNITNYDDLGSLGFKLVKYDKNGNLKWTVSPNLTGITIGAWAMLNTYVHSTIGSVSADNSGNVYITGNIRGGTLKIGNITRTFNHPNSGGLANGFIAKLDSNGTCQWILALNKFSGSDFNPVSVGDVITDEKTKSIYVKADFMNSIVFSDTVISNFGGNYTYLFVIDGDGNYKRMRPLHNKDDGAISLVRVPYYTASQCFNYEHKMMMYKDKLIFYAFTNKSTVSIFNGPTITAPPMPGFSNTSFMMAHVIVMDTLGNLISAFRPAVFYDSLSTSLNNYSFNTAHEPGISIDPLGNLYFKWDLGTFPSNGYMQNYYGPYPSQTGYYNYYKNVLKFNDNSEVRKKNICSVMAKYNLNGNLLWHKELDHLSLKSIVANNDGNIYGLGSYYHYAGFPSSNGNDQMISTNDTSFHMILYAYDPAGNFLWGKTFPASINGNQYPGEIFKKDTCNSNLYFSAAFDSTTSSTGNTYTDNRHLRIFKFSADGSCGEINCIPTSTLVTGIKNDIATSTTIFQVAPNPNKGQFSIHSNNKEELFIQVYNSTGQLITETNLQPDSTDIILDIANSGVYYVMAKGKTVKGGQKILVIK